MKNLKTALLFFCAFSLTNAIVASAPGGVSADLLSGGSGRGAYFQHDYVTDQQLSAELIAQSARSISNALHTSATRLGKPVTNGDLLDALDSRSTDASMVNSLLGQDARFDQRCILITKEAQELENEMMAAFGPRIAALQKEMRAAALLASQVSINAQKIAAELECKSKH